METSTERVIFAMGEPGDRMDDFRPRIGRRQRARDRVASSSLGVAVLVRRGHGRGTGAGRGKLAPAVGFGPRHNARRVIVKAHIQSLARHGARAAARHLRYIERDGVEKDGSPGVLYGPDGPVPHEKFEQPRFDERHQFRFILSPEDGCDLDLTDYVRRTMVRVERDLGRPIVWAAVNHHDTDHPHAHIVVRGVDRDGRPLRIQPAYMARGFRWSAQDLATELLGPRLESEIRRTLEREVTMERFTSLDRELERTATPERQVDVQELVPSMGSPDRELLVRRLEYLRGLGFAEPASLGCWVLAQGWQAHLRELGERGDILKQIHRAMDGGDPSRLHIVSRGQPLPDEQGGIQQGPVVARIARVGLADERKGTFFAVFETATGTAYYLPVSGRTVDALRAGDIVSLTRAQCSRPTDSVPFAAATPNPRSVHDHSISRRNHPLTETCAQDPTCARLHPAQLPDS